MILHKNKLDIFILFSEINNEFLFLLKGDPLAKIKPKAIIRKKVQNKLHAYRVNTQRNKENMSLFVQSTSFSKSNKNNSLSYPSNISHIAYQITLHTLIHTRSTKQT